MKHGLNQLSTLKAILRVVDVAGLGCRLRRFWVQTAQVYGSARPVLVFARQVLVFA